MKRKIFLVIMIPLVLILLISSIDAQETEEKMFCGNGICEQDLGENKTLCPNDCGEVCKEDWTCTKWSRCIEGKKTRNCRDMNDCETNESKPLEAKNCTISKTTVKKTNKPFMDLYDNFCHNNTGNPSIGL